MPVLDDSEQARSLGRMKAIALAMLVLAAVIFIVTKIAEPDHPALGYVRATAEAAMVGAFADWFAVTALFRHPLGIAIPHTAIIPTRKSEIGSSLADFVQHNFLTPDVVAEKVEAANIAHRLGVWAQDPANARSVGHHGAAGLRGVLEVIDDDEVGPGIQQVVIDRVRTADAAGLVSRLVDIVIEGGHQDILYDSTLKGAMAFIADNRVSMRNRLAEESPWWVPEAIDDKVFDKLVSGFMAYLEDIRSNPSHELRLYVDRRSRDLADRLRTDEKLKLRGEALKQELLDHPEFQKWSAGLWTSLREAITEVTADNDSELRRRFEAAVVQLGQTIQSDPELEKKINDWIISAARYVAAQGSSEFGELIRHTIDRWDPEDTSRRIELQVGRDLQFIRINGTLVGGLVGLTIHTFSELVL